MYLKAIEVNGFKSFSDKIKLDFKKGITSIVGPNGSGKSNILDAILWVLGEQSHKSIRAKEGTDVIFSGGKNKAPKSMGQVSLVIDNSDNFLPIDYSEVKIERRIYRSGENEYYINNNKVRLKDINELFMDTGIGKNAYSVIGQGKVEQIILSNPKDLRNIIEEAAGIKKVKSKKEEAEKNLQNVEENIEKIGYIENEILSSLEPLASQAEKTREYLSLKAESDFKMKRVLKKTLMLKETDKNIIEEHLVNQKEYIENCEKEFDEKEQILEKINQEREEKEKDIESIEKEISQLKDGSAKLSSKIGVLTERTANIESEIKEKLDEIASIEVKINEKNSRIKEIEEEYSKISDESNRSVEGVESKKRDFEAAERELVFITKDIEELKRVLVEKEIERVKLQNTAETNQKNIKSAEGIIEKIAKELIEYETQKKEIEETLKKINKENNDTEIRIENILNEKNRVNEKRQNLEITIRKNEQNIKELNYQIQNKSTKKETLVKLEEANEGFFTGVKEILNLKKNGVLGPFISVVDIPENLEVAIQAAVGNSMQDIVVEDSSVAKECIEFLKLKKLGRASFLPFDTVRPFSNGKIEGNGILGIASDLVKYESKFEKIVKFVLGNILVVENIESAVKVSKDGKFNGSIVSLDGEIISGRGKISGGERVKSGISVIFERKREITHLESELEICINNLKEITDLYEGKTAELRETAELLATLSIEEESLRRNAYDLNSKKISSEKEYKSILNNYETIIYEKELEEENLLNLKNKIVSGSGENSAITEKIDEIKRNIALNEELFVKQKTSFDELSESYSAGRIEAAKVTEQLKTYQDKIYYEKKELQEYIENKNRNEMRINLIKSGKNDIESELKKLQVEMESLDLKCKNSEQTVKVEKDKYKQLEAQEKEKIVEIRAIENKIVQDKNSFTKKSEELEKIKSDILNLFIKAEEIGGLDEIEPAEDHIKEKKEYEELEKKIAVIGAVNLLAVEEYERVNTKYLFIKEQKEDLTLSKDSLKKLIQEIEIEMSEKFVEAYEKIRENFAYMCQEVLNSSDGDIYLTDPENMLETGVELMVKFKNKKYQSLTLLSGGEKSMIAVAFIMAIFMYKPSPFTFFDEIEAALDEVNTKKLIKMLKNFTEMSQFILITHNKETMKESDVLYGVTMNKEIGCSRIISVEI